MIDLFDSNKLQHLTLKFIKRPHEYAGDSYAGTKWVISQALVVQIPPLTMPTIPVLSWASLASSRLKWGILKFPRANFYQKTKVSSKHTFHFLTNNHFVEDKGWQCAAAQTVSPTGTPQQVRSDECALHCQSLGMSRRRVMNLHMIDHWLQIKRYGGRRDNEQPSGKPRWWMLRSPGETWQ